ncbi:MAG: hypothetical protein JSR54_15525 [Proteobacteria bacterium]|nr:hypothetical protein [Pseudomonadota bacterium]
MRNAAARARGRCVQGGALLIAVLGLVATGAAAAADHDHEHGGDTDWLVFPSVTGRTHWDDTGPPADTNNDWVKADLVYSHAGGTFRALAEAEVSSEEAEFERLQVGWDVGENTVLWLGRYHQPTSAWNIDHHHGRYLQTSVTRPAIEHWEDEGGVLPQHLAGALLDSKGALTGDSGLSISAAIGAGPVVTDQGFDPVRVLHSNHGGHRAAYTARVGFLPDLLGEDAFGLLYAHYDLPVVDPQARLRLGADTLTEQVLGGYANLNRGAWRVRAAVYHVDSDDTSALGTRHEHFGAGYAQVEYATTVALTPYSRLETSAGLAGSSLDVLQRDQVDVRRALAGLRWDFRRHQALTLEIGHAATAVNAYHEVRLQWSGVLP